MRFACQSCGKPYNLPEERIAGRNNVKLKCRVCGAIVEVKKKGEVVAQLLPEDKTEARLSEAPTPMASMAPSDPGAAPPVSLTDGGEPIMPVAPPPARMPDMSLPAPPPIESAPSPQPPVAQASEPAAPLPPPPMTSSGPPPLDPGLLSAPPPLAGGLEVGSAAPPPALESSLGPASLNSPSLNGAAARSGGEPPAFEPPAAADQPAGDVPAPARPEPVSTGESADTTKKMIAAFLTGVLIDRLIVGLGLF